MKARNREAGGAPRAGEAGFTLIELLIVVAIIGILAAAVIPALQRAVLKARVNRLANDAKTLYKAFVQYNIDHSNYPSTSTPPERAFDPVTLAPLVGEGYVKTPEAILGMLSGRQVTSYDSPNVGSADTQFWAVLTLAPLPQVQIVIGDTSEFPGFVGTNIEGGYFIYGTQLVPLDTNILNLLGR